MKFNTCSIHKENIKGKAQLQVTFDEDYNLPDYKPDISSVILKQGSVTVEEVKVTKGHVWVKGTLKFEVLYRAEQNSLGFCSTAGSAGFQENIALDKAEEFDTASVECMLEDLSIHITNSRKLAIRGLIQLNVVLSEFVNVDVPCEIEDGNHVEILKNPLNFLQLNASGRDQCRVHEELELSANKLNVQNVIWKDIRLEAITTASLAGAIQMKGELSVFCLYQAEPGIRMEWYENRLPIQCRIEVPEADSDSICYVKILDNDWNLLVQEDNEGENRVLVIDGTIKVEYRIYQECEKQWIQDLYALDRTLIPKTERQMLEQLLMKNESRYKVNDVLSLEPGQKEILQICNCSGAVQIDRKEVIPDGILVEGTVAIQVLYLTQDDVMPIDAVEGLIPFQFTVEAPGITGNCRYDLKEDLNLLNVMMKNSSMLEIQAVLDFNLIVFTREEIANILSIEEEPLKLESLLSMPGLTGIRIKSGDTLWSVAKGNHTTQDAIRQNNPTLEEPLRPGAVLLLLKQME